MSTEPKMDDGPQQAKPANSPEDIKIQLDNFGKCLSKLESILLMGEKGQPVITQRSPSTPVMCDSERSYINKMKNLF